MKVSIEQRRFCGAMVNFILVNIEKPADPGCTGRTAGVCSPIRLPRFSGVAATDKD